MNNIVYYIAALQIYAALIRVNFHLYGKLFITARSMMNGEEHIIHTIAM